MPRPVSLSFRQAVEASRTGEVIVLLLTITHPSIDPPIRVTSERTDVLSRGNTFVPYPFDLRLPELAEENPPVARISVDNIARDITLALEQTDRRTPPSVLIEWVLASDPDTVEGALEGLVLRRAHYDVFRIEGELRVETYDDEPYPADHYLPSTHPAMFRS